MLHILLSSVKTDVSTHFLLVLFALAAVATACFMVVRIFGPGIREKNSTRRLKLTEKLTLDTRHSVYIVSLDDEELLLGTGEKGIAVLSRNRKPETPKIDDDR